MSMVARKLSTLHRVVRTRGLPGVTSALRERWREARRAADVLAARLRHGRPRMLVHLNDGIGDDLVCTVLCRELRRRAVGPVWMLSRYPDLYQDNGAVAAVLP
jgi:hypothetical protein